MKFSPLPACTAALLAALPFAAGAQTSGNVALTSFYKFRGQDQDTRHTRAVRPAVQGGIEHRFGESGWYLGNWNSTVRWLPGNHVEMDFFGGYRFKAGPLDLDLGGMLYAYPGASSGNTTELYGAATWGPLTARYAHTVSQDYFGWAGARAGSGLRGRNTGYLNLAWSHAVAPSTTLQASVGYTHFAQDIRGLGVPSYVDYSLGGAYDFGAGVDLAVAVAGANRTAYFGDANRARLVLTLRKSF